MLLCVGGREGVPEIVYILSPCDSNRSSFSDHVQFRLAHAPATFILRVYN